jgi:hypothetical protein
VTGGAVGAAPRLCKAEGCGGSVVARGMCDLHYRRWRRAHPDITMMAMTQQTLLDAMPATIPKLIEKTGMCRETVLRTLDLLNVAGPARRAYIYGWEPPAGKGKNWQAIYREGSRPNKRLTKGERAAHSRALSAAYMARRFPHRQPAAAPPRASWLDVLGLAA